MVDSLWKILSFIMVVVLLIVLPLLTNLNALDQLTQIELIDIAGDFIESTIGQSALTDHDFLNFSAKLNSLGYDFDIKIIHEKSFYIPSADDDTLLEAKERVSHQEIMDLLFTGENTSDSNDLKPNSSTINGIYLLNQGDYFGCEIKVKNKTKFQILYEHLMSIDLSYPRFYIKLGGLVNHAYR